MNDIYTKYVDLFFKGVALLIAAYGIYQFYLGEEQKRADRTLSYVAEFYKDEISSARQNLSGVLYAVANDPKITSAAEADEAVKSGLNRIDMRAHYDIVVEYFDRIQNCVAVGACLKDIVIDLLQDEAINFRKTVYFRYVYLRTLNKFHGFGLENIANN